MQVPPPADKSWHDGAAPLDADPALDILDSPLAGPTAIRGGAVRAVAYLLNVGLGVVAAAVLIRYLEPATFGRYATVTSLVTIAAGITEAGMTNIGVREYAVLRGGERAARLADLLGLRLVLALAGGLAAVAFAAAAGYDKTAVAGALLVSASMVVLTAQTMYTIPLQSRLQLGSLALLDTVRQALMVGLVAVLVVGGAALLPFFAVPLVAASASVVMTVLLIRGAMSLTPRFRPREWRRIGGVILPYAAANTVGIVYGYFAIIAMSLLSTESQTGYFAAAHRTFVVLVGIPAVVVLAAFPVLSRAARDDRARLAYATARLTEIALILGAGMMLATVLGAGPAIRLVAGPDFDPAIGVLRLQGLALVASSLLATWGFVLLSLGRFRPLLIVNAIAFGLSAAVVVGLVPKYDARGAAIGTIVGDFALAIGYAVALREFSADLRSIRGRAARVLLACAIGACAALTPLSDVPRTCLALLAYATLLVALRAVPPEVGDALTAPFRKAKLGDRDPSSASEGPRASR